MLRDPDAHAAARLGAGAWAGTGISAGTEAMAGAPSAASSPASSADQLAKLADLRDRNVITAAEFDREKAKILA